MPRGGVQPRPHALRRNPAAVPSPHRTCAPNRVEAGRIPAVPLHRPGLPIIAGEDPRREASRHGRERIPDLLDGNAAFQEPRDEFGPFRTSLALEAVEQPGRFDVDVFGHRVNVYRALRGRPEPSTTRARWSCRRDRAGQRSPTHRSGTAYRPPARRVACAVATSRHEP